MKSLSLGQILEFHTKIIKELAAPMELEILD